MEGCLEEVALGGLGGDKCLQDWATWGGCFGSCPPPLAPAAESRGEVEPPLPGVVHLHPSPGSEVSSSDHSRPLPEPFGLGLPCLWSLLG